MHPHSPLSFPLMALSTVQATGTGLTGWWGCRGQRPCLFLSTAGPQLQNCAWRGWGACGWMEGGREGGMGDWRDGWMGSLEFGKVKPELLRTKKAQEDELQAQNKPLGLHNSTTWAPLTHLEPHPGPTLTGGCQELTLVSNRRQEVDVILPPAEKIQRISIQLP